MDSVPAGPGRNDQWDEYYDQCEMRGPEEPFEFIPEISISTVMARIVTDIEDETFDYEYDYGKTIRSYVKDTVTRRGLLSADGKRQMAIVYRGIVTALHADGAIDKGDRRMLLLHMRVCEGEFQ